MQYTATINWKRHSATFDTKTYDRTHNISLASKLNFNASSAPEFAGKPDLPNPEELFTASISSCFMLTFLYWAAMKGVIVDAYTDEAVGKLGKNEEGKMSMTEVTLKPKVTFGGNAPDETLLNELFKKAHDNCFISCSVKTKIVVTPETVSA